MGIKNTALKYKLKQMALTPRTQFKQLFIGTLGAFVCSIILVLGKEILVAWSFYTLAAIMFLFILYAIPGYIGIWLWRMRKTFFDRD